MKKIPYMLIVGEKEASEGLVSVRSRAAGDEGAKTLDEFIVSLKEEIDSKVIREAKKD